MLLAQCLEYRLNSALAVATYDTLSDARRRAKRRAHMYRDTLQQAVRFAIIHLVLHSTRGVIHGLPKAACSLSNVPRVLTCCLRSASKAA